MKHINLYLVVGEFAVKDVEYSKTTKKLLLCLQPSSTRSAFFIVEETVFMW